MLPSRLRAKKIHLLYNLCNDVLLTDIKLLSSAKKYKVYASDDINKIWEDDSLIYSYSGKGANGKTLTGGAAKSKYRYIRFEITDFNSPLKLYEASVIGGDNQLLKYKQISRTFSYGNVDLATYNYETKKYDFFSTDAYLYKLFDNDIYTSICIEGGMHNEETVDMTVTFDDVKNIDSISIYFPDMLDGYNPTKLELYTSEIVGEFSNGVPEGTEPLARFDTLPEDGLYKVDFKPQFARVMVIRFVCGNLDYDGYEDKMCFALNEIKIMGTSVVGIQPDEYAPELLSFTDEATGVTAQVLKYDKNDIFTGVTGIKVSKTPATFKQKQSIAKSGYMKIIDETVYTVDFINSVGDVITDLGGREHRIKIPFDRTQNDYLMLASATDNECKVLESRVDGEEVYCDREEFVGNQYMLVGFASSDDPYFENLDVVVPEDDTQSDVEELPSVDNEDNSNDIADENISSDTEEGFEGVPDSSTPSDTNDAPSTDNDDGFDAVPDINTSPDTEVVPPGDNENSSVNNENIFDNINNSTSDGSQLEPGTIPEDEGMLVIPPYSDSPDSGFAEDFSEFPDSGIYDGTNEVIDENTGLNDIPISPETGESKAPMAIAIVLFALSALSITAIKRSKVHLK